MSACGSTPRPQVVRTETVEVNVPILVQLPEELTRDCDVPAFPETLTVASIEDLVVFLYTSLEVCNQEKAAIREMQP